MKDSLRFLQQDIASARTVVIDDYCVWGKRNGDEEGIFFLTAGKLYDAVGKNCLAAFKINNAGLDNP